MLFAALPHARNRLWANSKVAACTGAGAIANAVPITVPTMATAALLRILILIPLDALIGPRGSATPL
jgi:hypothetical protein